MTKVLDDLDSAIDEMTQDEKRQAYISKFRSEFVLVPPFFEQKLTLPDLQWNKIQFTEARKRLPKNQGVYVFSVEVQGNNLPSNSYVLYVGKAGDINSKNTIAKRYRNYVREKNNNIRSNLHTMLNQWYGNLSYSYASVPIGQSTGEIEQILTTIFVPPYNTNDFTAEVKTLLKGASIL